MSNTDMDTETRGALDAARTLQQAGCRLFIARPALDPDTGEWMPKGGTGGSGYWLPKGWQDKASTDPKVLDRWRPGMGLAMVGGDVLDVVDVDPRNGGEASWADMLDVLPRSHARAMTPSGGWHTYVAKLGVRKRTNLRPGIDVQAGHEGEGVGFVWLPPTRKVSKATGEAVTYRWEQRPDAGDLAALELLGDDTGELLAAEVTSAHEGHAADLAMAVAAKLQQLGQVSEYAELTAAQRELADEQAERIRDHWSTKAAAMAEWDDGEGDEHGGWEKNTADAAYALAGLALAPWSPVELDEADDDFHDWFAPMISDAGVGDKWLTQLPRAEADGPRAWPTIPWAGLLDDFDAIEDDAPADVAEAMVDAATEPDPEAPGKARRKLPRLRHFNPGNAVALSTVATEVVRHVRAHFRFAVDTRTWYARDDEASVWVPLSGTAEEGARLVCAVLAEHAPRGVEPDRGKDAGPLTDENREWLRWEMLGGAKRGALARFIVDEASRGDFREGSSETAPDQLWAAGWLWDLRASAEVPTVVDGDDGLTPHLRTAAVCPAKVPTPRFDALLHAALDGDAERIAYAWRCLGHMATGLNARVLVMPYGPAKRGKSQTMTLADRLLGSYAAKVSAQLLSAAATESQVADLLGLRMAWLDESPRTGFTTAETIKDLTGGTPRRAARKFRDSFTFPATYTLCVPGNEDPSVADEALKSRVRPLLFDGDPEAVSRAVAAIYADDNGNGWVATEGPGVLARMMAEAAVVLADPDASMAVPLAAAHALDAMEQEQNPVSLWVSLGNADTNQWTPTTEAYASFREWAEFGHYYGGRAGRDVPSIMVFGKLLARAGIEGGRQRIEGKRVRAIRFELPDEGTDWMGF